LVAPEEPDRLLDDPQVRALNNRDDYMPYWAYIWPGAYLLAEAVMRQKWEPGLEALEIGCGLGLAGLAGLTRGLHVHFTDYDETPLEFASRSAAENGFGPSRYRTSRLDWRSPPPECYPVILGADVLYEQRLVPLVCGLLARMLEPAGVALLAGPYRVATELLPAELERHGLAAEAEAVETTDQTGRLVRGQVHCVRFQV
jgi:predicted nicotinamide N-methyase